MHLIYHNLFLSNNIIRQQWKICTVFFCAHLYL